MRRVGTADEVQVVAYDGAEAALTDELLALYGEVYAGPPYRDGPEDVAEFAAEWPRLLAEPGFRLVVARVPEGRLVGLALGHVLGPGSGWWSAVRPTLPTELTEESVGADGVGRSFGIAEFGVHPDWLRVGIARRLHDGLLDGRAEARVVLWVHTDAVAARATYDRWGYRFVGTVPASSRRAAYHVLCLTR